MAAYFAQIGQTLKVEKVAAVVWRVYLVMKYKNQTMSKDIYDVSWGKKLQGKDSNHCPRNRLSPAVAK